MKNFLKGLALVALSLLLLPGCTTHTSQSFWEVTKTKAKIESDNFRVAKLGVQGNSSCSYLFGSGGDPGFPSFGIPIQNPNLVQQAMQDFHKRAKMQGKSAFLHNINVERTRRGVPFIFCIQYLTITADVYEFTKDYRDYKDRD